MDIETLISQVPLFSSLPDSEIKYLAATLRTRAFPAQKLLIQEGHTDERFYIILDGQVEIIKALGTSDERLLGVRSKGVSIGEMSLFSYDQRHTASVRAQTPVKVLEMTRADYDDLLSRQPYLAYEMARMISMRLEESENLTILDLKEKNRQLILAYQELQAAQAQIVEKEKLEHELEIARQIQISILPQSLPKRRGFDFGALMIPARAVGGDFYDFIPLGRGKLGVVVGDVSDKGVPSALFMALCYSLVRAEARRFSSLRKVIQAVNSLLLEINGSGMFVTLLYGVLDYATRQFNFIRSGHPCPIILDQRGCQIEIAPKIGQALGLFEEPLMDEQSIFLPVGGTLLVYSDGMTEAIDEGGRDFGVKGVSEALLAGRDMPAQQVCQLMWEKVSAYSGSLPQFDDVTLVCIRLRGNEKST